MIKAFRPCAGTSEVAVLIFVPSPSSNRPAVPHIRPMDASTELPTQMREGRPSLCCSILAHKIPL